MSRLIQKCPVCRGSLHVSGLKCPECGMELRNDFEFSPFDRLDNGQYEFLLVFLQHRGNLKEVQAHFQIPYPTAKKRLEDLLAALGLKSEPNHEQQGSVDDLYVDTASQKASERVKAKLKENGGRVTVFTARGLPCEFYAEPGGRTFGSDKLPIHPGYGYEVFDVIENLLRAQGGRARKGNGRNCRLGEPGCEETTVVGAVAKYLGRKRGESVYDPVFVLAAVLEWAGVARNQRGYLELEQD